MSWICCTGAGQLRDICRFLIEQNIRAIDRGPSSYLNKFSVENSRTSADYRFVKNEQKLHALKYMEYNNFT